MSVVIQTTDLIVLVSPKLAHTLTILFWWFLAVQLLRAVVSTDTVRRFIGKVSDVGFAVLMVTTWAVVWSVPIYLIATRGG